MRRIPTFKKILIIAAAIVLCTWVTGGVMAQPAPGAAIDIDDATPLERDSGITTVEADDPFLGAVAAEESLDVTATLAKSRALLRLGKDNEGILELRRIIANDPNHLMAHELLRDAAKEVNRPDQVADLTASLCQIYVSLGNLDIAGERLDELILVAPAHPRRLELESLLGRKRAAQTSESTDMLTRMRSLIGMALLIGIAYAMSVNRKQIRWRIVFWGIGMQAVFAVIVLKTTPGRWVFDLARDVVNIVLGFTDAGARFLFGKLYDGTGPGPTSGPVQYLDGTTGDPMQFGAVFAFHVLPTIIFFGGLMAILYHLGLIQKVVRGIAWLMTRTMGTSGSESLAVASNIFVGQTEAPLVVKPYVERMTRSELMAVMTGGFATVSGGVLAAYVRFGIDAGHLMAASVMNAPAAFIFAKLMFPETEQSETAGGSVKDPPSESANVIDAAAAGASDGLKLALNVAAMLIAFIAFIAMINFGLGKVGGIFDYPQLSLKEIFGVVLYPLSWAMGADTQDLLNFGHLLGTKISLNEFVAFADLGHLRNEVTPRTFTIATYALCGFANFSSIGIQIGGISAIAPSRRSDLARLGLRAMIAGAAASCLTACVAGLLL